MTNRNPPDHPPAKPPKSGFETPGNWFSGLYGMLPVGVSVTDETGVLIDINPRYAEIFGYRRAELIGTSHFTLLADIPADEMAARYRAFITREPPVGIQGAFKARRRDGRRIYISLNARRSTGTDGRPVAISVIEDITEKQQAELLLAAQRDLSLALDGTVGFESALGTCLSAAIRVSETDCGGIYLRSPDTGALELKVHQGLPEPFVRAAGHYPADAHHTRLVLKGEPIYGPFPLPGFPGEPAEMVMGIREAAVIPIAHEGRILGAMNMATRTASSIAPFCRHALETIAGQIGVRIERFQREAQFERRRRADAIIAAAARRFVRGPGADVRETITAALADVSAFAGVERARVWRLSADLDDIHLYLEWCAAGIDPFPPDIRVISCTRLPWWFRQMRRQRAVHVARLDDLPPEAEQEKEILRRQGVRAMAMLPLFHSARLIGCVAFHTVTREKEWRREEVRLLETIADLFSEALIRREVEERLKLFQTVLETSGEAIVISDADFRRIYVNPAYTRLFGCSGAESLGMPCHDVYTPESVTVIEGEVRPLLAEGIGWEGELAARNAEGRVFTLWQRCDTIRDDQGRVGFFFGLMHDMTAEKQAQRERLHHMEQRLRMEKARSLNRMAGAVTHHINNRLAVIMGNLEMVMEDLPATGEIGEELSACMEAARATGELTSLLLLYLGHGVMRVRTLNLGRLCRALQALGPGPLPPNFITMDSLPQTGPTILADPNRMRQALEAILTNAWEAVQTVEQPRITLSLTTTAPGTPPADALFPHDWVPYPHDHACLTIADNGGGIAAEHLESICDPFFSTRFTGRGMGLAVVLGIVGRLGGAVAVASRPGDGTAVTLLILLPADPPQPSGGPPETTAEPAQDPNGAGRRPASPHPEHAISPKHPHSKGETR